MNENKGLEVSGVTRTFGTHRALNNLNLNVEPGIVASILGPNGSGKSTSMKILSGVLSPTAGTVRLNGIELAADPLEFKKLTGFVPDVGGLFPRLTGWEHLELAARLWKLRNWESRARELFDQLDLSYAAGKRTSSYSHGMSRKLSASIAFLSNPQLVLLDEPFDGVDPLGVDALNDLVFKARDRGACVLVSTHLLDVADHVSDKVFVIGRGELKAAGTPEELRVSTSSSTLADAYKSLLS